MVLAGGVFMALMPKRLPFRCATCNYDLEGLEGVVARCPECGRAHAMAYHEGDACHACGEAIDRRRVPAGGVTACPACGLIHFGPRRRAYVGASAAQTPVGDADQQHQHRQPRDHDPADQRERRRGDVADDGERASGGRLSDEVVLPA
jgi:predicted RNA-binding Zn-ribbon protein involved in translation (DUF1610 family)